MHLTTQIPIYQLRLIWFSGIITNYLSLRLCSTDTQLKARKLGITPRRGARGSYIRAHRVLQGTPFSNRRTSHSLISRSRTSLTQTARAAARRRVAPKYTRYNIQKRILKTFDYSRSTPGRNPQMQIANLQWGRGGSQWDWILNSQRRRKSQCYWIAHSQGGFG